MKLGILFIAAFSLIMVSCSKGEGPGGKASISGTITKQNLSNPEAEISEIVCTNGSWPPGSTPAYFLLNTPKGLTDYVFYYTISGIGANPNLTGRTAVNVNILGTDDNIQVATKTKTAITTGAGADFIVQQDGDLLTIHCRHNGHCNDIDDWDTPHGYDVINQGSSAIAADVESGSDERVYIKYGDSDIYNDDFRTDYDGSYRFAGLKKGSYIIYLQTLDETTGLDTIIQKGVTISSSTEEVIVEDINILY